MDPLIAIGIAATVVSSSRSLPQLVRTLRTRVVNGLTPATPAITAVSALGWLAYALMVGDRSLLATSLVSAVGATLLAVSIARFGSFRQGHRRMVVAWGVLLMVIAAIGGAPVLAGLLTLAVLVNAGPQVAAVHRQRTAPGVSVAGWSLAALEGVLWAAYGMGDGDPALVLWGVTAIVPALVVLSLVVPARRDGRRRRTRVRIEHPPVVWASPSI